MPRIGLVHALYASIAPVEAAFAQLWPEAETVSLLDASLYVDFSRDGKVTDGLAVRIASLLEHSESCGAQAILFTGSLFGAPVREAGKARGVPVLTSYEALIEAAFARGSRFAVVATVAGTIDALAADIDAQARERDVPHHLETRWVAGAMEALLAGDRARHDRLVAAEVIAAAGADVVLLGQFSMAPVLSRLPARVRERTLSPPHCAAVKLRKLLGGGA